MKEQFIAKYNEIVGKDNENLKLSVKTTIQGGNSSQHASITNHVPHALFFVLHNIFRLVLYSAYTTQNVHSLGKGPSLVPWGKLLALDVATACTVVLLLVRLRVLTERQGETHLYAVLISAPLVTAIYKCCACTATRIVSLGVIATAGGYCLHIF
jgi:hypothetical protein